MSQPITLRPCRPDDLDALATICFDAFGAVNRRHGFPSDFTEPAMTRGLMGFVLNNPHVYGVVAEVGGRVVGSNFIWEGDPIAGIGPITVAQDAQGGVGRRLMEDVLARAAGQKRLGVRLVQAAFNTTSFSLYTKLGFDVREPLVGMNGPPFTATIPGYGVRPAREADVATCASICTRVHGHERSVELRGSIAQGTATVVEQGGAVVGYSAGVGFMTHTVALDNTGLMALIGGAGQIAGPGLLLPSRNGEVLRWCLDRGLRVIQPMTLMSKGLYNEPRGAFLPSILY